MSTVLYVPCHVRKQYTLAFSSSTPSGSFVSKGLDMKVLDSYTRALYVILFAVKEGGLRLTFLYSI
jgi:hypothetical protein